MSAAATPPARRAATTLVMSAALACMAAAAVGPWLTTPSSIVAWSGGTRASPWPVMSSVVVPNRASDTDCAMAGPAPSSSAAARAMLSVGFMSFVPSSPGWDFVHPA